MPAELEAGKRGCKNPQAAWQQAGCKFFRLAPATTVPLSLQDSTLPMMEGGQVRGRGLSLRAAAVPPSSSATANSASDDAALRVRTILVALQLFRRPCRRSCGPRNMDVLTAMGGKAAVCDYTQWRHFRRPWVCSDPPDSPALCSCSSGSDDLAPGRATQPPTAPSQVALQAG